MCDKILDLRRTREVYEIQILLFITIVKCDTTEIKIVNGKT